MRWVTWFPAPYWNARFNHLARRSGIDFRALFLSKKSPEHDWDFSDELFAFDYEYVATMFPNRVPLGLKRRGFPAWAFERDSTLILPYPEIDLMLAIISRRVLGRRTFAFTDNTITDFRSWSWLHEASKSIAMRLSSGVLVGGPIQADYARRYAGTPDRVHELGNPVDNEWFLQLHERLRGTRSEIRRRLGLHGLAVLYVGRLWHGKDVDTLIRAFAMIPPSYGAHLVIAGDGPEEQRLRILAEVSGRDVRFLGFQDRLSLARLYEACDVLVLPSRSEPWGMVVNEAMLFDKPVIVSDHVGARATLVRDGHNGYIFPTGDASSLARQIDRLARFPDEARIMGSRSAEIVKSQGIAQWADRLIAALTN